MNYSPLICALSLSILPLYSQTGSTQTGSAIFEFISVDSNTEGFNDPTPRDEIESELIGNNPGLTLGEIRRNVLVQAGIRWSNFLLSDVPIRVEVDFDDLGPSSGGSISLAGASPATFSQNFANAPLANTLYPIALANSLAGTDLSNQPDIFVSANSNEELSNSLSGSFTWYYGFDGNGPNGTIDFLNVISHELGHGLGFSDNLNSTTGNFFGGRPNIYATHVFDSNLNLTWPQMTAAQRVTSARSDPNLAWSGSYVTGAIDGVESFVTRGSITSSGNSFAALQASFGGDLPAEGISGNLVLADDGIGIEVGNGEGSTADLAQDIQNTTEVSGNIALIARGLENFDVKVSRAEGAGAIGAIVYNNLDDPNLVLASASGNVTEPTIPMVFVSQETGDELRELLLDGITFTMQTNVVTPNNGEELPAITRLRLFAPATFNPGSSVSHWSTAASPNLLMEPSINSNLDPDLDLSALLMKDLGWKTQNITIPHLTFDLWLADNEINPGQANSGPNDDLDNDGLTNLEEYFYGTNPTSPTIPQLEFSNGILKHPRFILANDLTLQYENSGDLVNFESFSTSPTINSISDILEENELELDLSAESQFFRLSIESLQNN